jgi:hypothetical protein
MVIIDSLKKISHTICELPPSYKEDMRVQAVYKQISNVAITIANQARRGQSRCTPPFIRFSQPILRCAAN